jgi:hypothetical protein
MRRVRELFLPWKSNKHYIFVSTCVFALACAWVHMPGPAIVCIRVRACSLSYPACKLHAPYFNAICGPSGSMIFFRYCLINGAILEKKKLLNTKCVFWFSLQLLHKIFLILRRIYRDIVINVKNLHVKYLLFLSVFNETWILATDFRKKLKYQVLSKFVPWEPSCSTRTERQTDMTKTTVSFRNFAKAPKM